MGRVVLPSYDMEKQQQHGLPGPNRITVVTVSLSRVAT